MSETKARKRPEAAKLPVLVTAQVIDLRPNPKNPNKHPESQIEFLMASLRKDGQTRPLLVRKSNSMLIAGHGVHTAMRRLGWTECQAMMWDCDEQTAHRVMLADDQLATLSELDPARTRDLLQEIGETDLGSTGFTQEDMAKLFQGETSAGELEVYEIETSSVTDSCWVAAQGPLHLQAEIIMRMKQVMADLPAVVIKVGTLEDQ